MNTIYVLVRVTWVVLLLCTYTIQAQDYSPKIQLRHTHVEAIHIQAEEIPIKEKLPETAFGSSCFLLLKFKTIPDNIIHKKLKNNQIDLLKYISNQCYMARVPKEMKLYELLHLNVTSILPLPQQSKINSSLQHILNIKIQSPSSKKIQVLANYFKGTDMTFALSIFDNYGGIKITKLDLHKQLVTLDIHPKDIHKIAALPFIHTINPTLPKPQYTTYNGRGQHGVDYVQRIKGLTGKSVTVGVGDRGRFEHLDGQHRTINYDTLIDYHGSLIAGIIGGAGNIRESYRGMAPECNLLTTAAQQVLDSLPIYYTNHGVVLTNNSYKFNRNLCDELAQYNMYSGILDDQLMAYDEVMHVFSAANDALVNVNGCNGYPPRYQTVASHYNAGKNTLTVAGIRYDNTAYSSSGRGPTTDGRIKPEITAKALNVYGAASIPGNLNKYTGGNGTSFAVPIVTGAMALMYEQYKKNRSGQNPSGALMKAIACNTAEDIGNPGPDYTYGFGRIDAKRAIEVIKNEQFYEDSLSHNETKEDTISIPSGLKAVRVMLYWHDEAGSEAANKMLINDLNINLLSPDGTSYLPWILDPSPAGCTADAVRGVDTLNNIEQITIDSPSAGDYVIRVAGDIVPFGTKKFYINYVFIKEEMTFNYPVGNDGIRAGVNTHLYWTAKGDSSAFSLSYSLDDGATWALMNDSISGTERYCLWKAPDVFSGQVRVKLERDNDTLISERFSISKRPTVTVSAYCANQVEVCWDEVAGAKKYTVYQLNPLDALIGAIDTVSALCHQVAIADTSATYWYSVRALFNHGQSGERAYAKKIDASTISIQQTDIQIHTLIEGPYNDTTGLMNPTLNTLNLLPAQSARTPAGQPYQGPPWNYAGTEGMSFSNATYDYIALQNGGRSVVDWVLVTLSTDVAGSDVLERRAALVLENGQLVFPESFVCLPENVPIYIRIQHRNHLAAVSAIPVSVINGVLTYDFRVRDAYNFGGVSAGQKEVATGIWAMYAADGMQTDNLAGYDVNGIDKAVWVEENGIFGFYLRSDFNLDGTIDGNDKILWSINNGVYSNVNK